MIRPAYPDELGRAKSLLNGHPVPPDASFLVAVKEHPVERLTAAIPWWKVSEEEGRFQLKFSFHTLNAAGLPDAALEELFSAVEALASQEGATAVLTDFPLTENHPLFKNLTTRGYQISQSETLISAPGEEVKTLFLAQENQLPADWRIESIRGRAPETFYPLVAAEGSLTPKTFKAYWDGSSRERFEGDLSHLILTGEDAEEKVIGLLLATLHGSTGLKIRIESISPDHSTQAQLISNALHQAAFQNCPEGFPEFITWSRQTQSAYQTGQAQQPRHTLQLLISRNK